MSYPCPNFIKPLLGSYSYQGPYTSYYTHWEVFYILEQPLNPSFTSRTYTHRHTPNSSFPLGTYPYTLLTLYLDVPSKPIVHFGDIHPQAYILKPIILFGDIHPCTMLNLYLDAASKSVIHFGNIHPQAYISEPVVPFGDIHPYKSCVHSDIE